VAFRPIGKIRVLDERGYAYIPKLLQNELGVKGKCTIPFYINANTILLIREGASKEDILRGIDLLKEDLALRWKENSDQDKEVALGSERTRGRPDGGE